MPSRTPEWPAWPEFTAQGISDHDDADFLAVKKTVIDEYGAEALRSSWIQVCNQLRAVTDEIACKGNSIIPVFNTEQVLNNGGFSPEDKAEVQRVGAFVFKGTIPEDDANNLYNQLRHYVSENKTVIKSWPAESPSMLVLYDSPVQNTLRAHPNQLRLQRLLNDLWHDESKETSPDPLVYHDGVRDRAPGQPFLGLGPHIDAGSLSRWADAAYRRVYHNIFSGNPEQHDCFDLGIRKSANQDMFPGMAHSSVFRSFQGWTALTPTAPREGTIMVYPNVKTAIAYVLLRPFFTPPSNPDELMDPEKWVLDDKTGWFPGTTKPDSQRLSRASHPHLRLEECLVYMPKVEAGDTVWWHADLCHAVDTDHLGKNNASVAFIGACPSTTINKRYVKKQLEATLAGHTSPDYSGDDDLDETTLKGYMGLGDLSAEAKKAFGFDLLDTAA
ncbi:DUF1479-domain-containing protein [Sarocladium strictum]